ncbi:MAG: hydantoinase B/oxoprolinase family protein [Pseudohongiellaceae bacterium]
MNPVQLNLFSSRVSAICDEMGLVLRRAAFSPNIKDRLDFSCALFGPDGELFAQAAHIPVHLGSMAFAMADIVGQQQWQQGDMLVLNDPFLGGTHLPDVTVISPVFTANSGEPVGFVANRAHHANIGCDTPGSMPVSSTLAEEGIIIPPTWLIRAGQVQQDALDLLQLPGDKLSGDFAAQAGANNIGVKRLQTLVEDMSRAEYLAGMTALNAYADRIMLGLLNALGEGSYQFADVLDDDGQGTRNIKLAVTLTLSGSEANLDFSGSAAQVPGNMNCPLSVAAAAVYYCFRCLLPDEVPACAGLFRRIHLLAPAGSIVNARRPAAVAAGNVETSMRLVDLVFGALAQALPDRIPAASQGTMNNIAMGHRGHQEPDSNTNNNTTQPLWNSRWDYYETLAGGTGAGPHGPGLDAAHSHMTNTLNTPIESLELHYPLRVHRYAIRRGSGGTSSEARDEAHHPQATDKTAPAPATANHHGSGSGGNGGDGVIREYEFLAPAQLSLLTERRSISPWSLGQGTPAHTGLNLLNGKPLPAKCSLTVNKGDRLTINTPGGGGWSVPDANAE